MGWHSNSCSLDVLIGENDMEPDNFTHEHSSLFWAVPVIYTRKQTGYQMLTHSDMKPLHVNGQHGPSYNDCDRNCSVFSMLPIQPFVRLRPEAFTPFQS